MATNRKIAPLTSLILLCIWILSPIVVMILNASHTDSDEVYKIWISLLFISGGLSYIPGLFYISKRLEKANLSLKENLLSLLPLFIFVLFFIWNIISTLFCDFPLLAIFGKVPLSDCLAQYFAFGGMILSGITIASNKKYTFILANIFITIATILGIISLINNDFTTLLCVNEKTNTFEYQSVFFNTNHYGYYLVISIMICAYLITYVEKIAIKIPYVIAFIVLCFILTANNTMGAYLAIFITLIFAIIWSFINKEDKKYPIIIFVLFLASTLIAGLFYNNNVISNFASMFTDISTLANANSTEESVGAIGSGRWELWKAAKVFIDVHPIIGWGPMNVGLSAHNMFLEIMIYCGIPGLIIYLSAFIVGAIRLIKSRKTINPFVKACSFAVVAYLISGFFGLTVFYTAPYFYIVLGICMSGCLGKLVDEK